MKKDILEYIRRSRSEAAEDARDMKAALVRNDRAAFERCLRDYLLKRFALPDDGGEDDIERLAHRSLIASKGEKNTLESDKAISCTNASSSEEKSLLFVLVVQRSLGLKLAPRATAAISTLPQLADRLWEAHKAANVDGAGASS